MKHALVALIIFILAATPLVYAQPSGSPRDGKGMMQRREHLKESLNLTEPQEAQMKKLQLDLERKQAQVQAKVRLARLDLKEIYLSDKLDRAAIEKLLKQVSDLQHQTKMNVVDFWFSVNGTLNADQQKIWKKHAGQLAEGMQERFRGGMRHGGRMMHDPPDDDSH